MKYKLVMSTKVEVSIDEEDLAKFEQYSGTGQLIRLKEAIVNPSFVVAIVKDKDSTYDLPLLENPDDRPMTAEQKAEIREKLKQFRPHFLNQK